MLDGLSYSCYSTGLFIGQTNRLQDGLGFVTLTESRTHDLTAKYTEAVQFTIRLCASAVSSDNGGAMGTLTDVCHGGRRNAKDTNVVCIGQQTHRVLKEQHVTKEDDQYTQRHEHLNIMKLYDYFDNDISFVGVAVTSTIRAHAHARNTSINKTRHYRSE